MKLRLVCAALVVVLAIVAGVVIFGGSTHATHSTKSPAVAGSARQPAFLPGARDTGTMLACERSLPAVLVGYSPDTTNIDGPTVEVSSRLEASHLAFYLQAVRYDACTGRDFERTGPPNFQAGWACDAWSAVSQLRNAGSDFSNPAAHGYPLHNALGSDTSPPAGC